MILAISTIGWIAIVWTAIAAGGLLFFMGAGER
jgi:hypothetical protein